jgi:hypothetical protein
MASVVDICNGSLNQLGASTIISLTEILKMQDYVMHDTHKYEIAYSDLTLGIVYKNEYSSHLIQLLQLGDSVTNLPYLQIVYEFSE